MVGRGAVASRGDDDADAMLAATRSGPQCAVLLCSGSLLVGPPQPHELTRHTQPVVEVL